MRRGLPRRKAGEAWPPVGTVVVSDEVIAAPDVDTAEATTSSDVVSERAASAHPGILEPTTSTDAPAQAEEPTQHAATSASAPVKPPRRGLPRRAGEHNADPEPASAVSPSTPTEATAAPVSPGLAAPQTPASSGDTAPARRRTGLPRPGAGSPSTSAAVPAGHDDSASPPTAAVEMTTEKSAAPAPGRRSSLPRGTGTASATPTPQSAPVHATESESESSPVPAATQSRPVRPTGPAVAAPVRPVSQSHEPKRIGRFTRPQWFVIVVVGGLGLLFAVAMVVLFARWFVSLDFMRDFLTAYPGETHLPDGAPVGLPAWLGWQHFLNAFFIVLIIRTGWQVRTQTRPPAMWVRKNEGLVKTRNPPKKISLTLWAHLSFDILWLLNGVTFVVLLFVTGQWMRVVPTSWDVIPNAVSAALQYVSLNWPTENGWVNYNSLQVLAYFVTIFIAAPLAAITGIRMSGAWPRNATRLNKMYPVEWARAVHLPVMLYFVLFVIMHVALVFATGALRNLNHMYASQDVVNWTGFWIFFGSLVVMIGAVLAARPLVLAPIAGLMGKVGR